MSAYAQKLESVRALFEEHNAQIEDAASKLNFSLFINKLKKEGGTSEEALVECSFEDIAEFGNSSRDCLMGYFPKLLAKRIAKIFRKKETKSKIITEKKVQLMNIRELLEAYNPKEVDLVSKRLMQISQKAFIVFNEDDSVNIDASIECLEDIKEGYEPREAYIGTDGVPQQIYHVGSRPPSVIEENPLLPGHALRGAAATCDQTHRSWSNIPEKVRVLLRLALESGELEIDQVTRIHDILDMLVNKSNEEMETLVSRRFHKAALIYQEKKLAGILPTLKIVRNGNSKSPKKQDPFHRNRRF